ncbi:MAG: ATP-binding protein [Deltaproteobacteria bacterium]|nr:ATP-binding protein [Deltaproteobacteria bacterium]
MMRDLSLHVLDLIENSIRAGATRIWITLQEHPALDRMEIVVEDNGCGFEVSPERAEDPFYTTKEDKHTGLGLSLLKAAAELTGGGMRIGESELGGAKVEVWMGLGHVDRNPLGDLAAALSCMVCTHPEIEIGCKIAVGSSVRVVQSSNVKAQLPEGERIGLAVARRVSQEIKRALADLGAQQ